HRAAKLRNRRPGKPVSGVQRLKPALDVEGFDVVRDFLAPLWDEIVANDMFRVQGGALGLGTQRIRPKVGFQVKLGKSVEADAYVAAVVVDAQQKTEPVDFAPCVLLF